MIAKLIRAIRRQVRASTARKYVAQCWITGGGIIWDWQIEAIHDYMNFKRDDLPL